MIIENPDSSKEQVDDAKSKLEEIKQFLSEEYNLVINSDNSNLEETVDQLTRKSKNELQTDINNQRAKLSQLNAKEATYLQDRNDLEAKYNREVEKSTKYSKLQADLSEVRRKRLASEINQYQEMAEITAAYEKQGLGKQRPGNINDAYSVVDEWMDKTSKKADELNGKIINLDSSHTELHAVSEELANWETELIRIAAINKDGEGIQQALKDMKDFINIGELDMSGYAQAAALAMNGVEKLETAWEQAANGDGTALTSIINDYIRAMNEFGASAEETATGAALIKSGFSDVSQVTAETLPTVLNNMRELGNAQGLDMTAEKLTQMAQAIKLIPQNTKIEFDGEGNIVLKVDDTEVEEYEAPDKPGKAPYSPDTSQVDAWTPPEKQGKVIYNAVMPEQFKNTNYGKFGANVFPSAQGTQNFPGGLAMVNDQTGISDNRELIIDRGRAFIPQGRNVILPLSKGAKVYTAAQTKAIMSGLGIPHYAEGKNNSDAFTAARDDWTHYTKTHAVTTEQELQKYLEFQEQFKDNEKDIWDMPENGGRKAVLSVSYKAMPFSELIFDVIEGPCIDEEIELDSDIPLDASEFLTFSGTGTYSNVPNIGDVHTAPVITVTGSTGIFTIICNGVKITVNHTGNFVIDCKKEIVYDGDISLMADTIGTFFELAPDTDNTITIIGEGTAQINYTPQFLYDAELDDMDWGDK